MDKETSPHVSSIAGLLIGITGGELWNRLHPDDHAMGNARSPVQIDACDKLAQEIRTLAGSCMSQDETPGQEKAPDDFFTRLKNEREELDGRIAKLQTFLSSEPAHISAQQLSLLDSQLSAMKVYLSILDLRLDDIGRSDTSSEKTHAE